VTLNQRAEGEINVRTQLRWGGPMLGVASLTLILLQHNYAVAN